MLRKSLVGPLALAAAAALLLSGCVNNEEAPATGGGGGAGISVDEASVALLPDDIKEAGKLVIGTDANYPPNEYKDPNGKVIGWEIDLIDAMAAKLGLETEYKASQFDNIIPSIVGNKLDFGLSSFTDTVEREEKVDFINYYTAGVQWASTKGTDVDPNNACGLKVAVQSTTFQDTEEVPAKSDACVAAGKEPIEKLQFEAQDAAANAVALGQADAFSADSPVTLYAIAQNDDKLQAAGETFDEAPYGLPIAKDSELTEAIVSALEALIADGTYTEILDEWGVANGGLEEITINAASKG
ncbi:ABC transporter substrate-binding protein [Mycetocola sp.]|jgi:polar amino acid transport system substrate-binding protein|uniref:ABC transporter substrate-binding protein n=1 Tax=Mycetocola sp. TaxID=1871042 RepID=UPI00261643EF|nr:ABC transporter substrate-binding protein [Mycetocola sp.]MCU1560947.1 transporter substrate-binding protein [Mycetocola sp.]